MGQPIQHDAGQPLTEKLGYLRIPNYPSEKKCDGKNLVSLASISA
jgi:hypothetical protein